MPTFRIIPTRIYDAVHAEGVSSVCFFADGRRLMSQSHEWSDEEDDVVGRTVVWDLDGQVLASRADVASTSSASLSPDGKCVAVSGFKDFTIHDTAELAVLHQLTVQGWGAFEVHFLQDGKRLAVAGRTKLQDTAPLVLFDCDRWAPVVLADHAPPVNVLTSALGRWLACGSWHHFVQVWDLDRRELAAEWVANPGDKDDKNHAVKAVAFCAGGSRLVTSGELLGTFAIWDSRSGRRVAQLEHPLVVDVLAPYPDDSFFLSEDAEGNIDLWDARTARIAARAEIGPLKVPSVDVSTGKRKTRKLTEAPGAACLAVSPDGRLIAAGTQGGLIYLYEITQGS